MKTPRLLALALAALALSSAPRGLAQDPAITGQLAKLSGALPNQKYPQPDFKSLNDAAQSLLKKIPIALTSPQATELNSPEPSGAQDPLDLSPAQRSKLLRAYQSYTGWIARLARTNPFTYETVREITNLHHGLKNFMRSLESLGKMDPTSENYGALIGQLIADAPPPPPLPPRPNSGQGGGQR